MLVEVCVPSSTARDIVTISYTRRGGNVVMKMKDAQVRNQRRLAIQLVPRIRDLYIDLFERTFHIAFTLFAIPNPLTYPVTEAV